MHTYEFPTAGAIATLTFSTDGDAEEIAAAVRSVFERYDRRFRFETFGPELRRLERGELQRGELSDELRDALQFAEDWRAHLGPKTDGAPIEPTNLQASVVAMSLESAAALLSAAGAEDWSLKLAGVEFDVVAYRSQVGAGNRKHNADSYSPV